MSTKPRTFARRAVQALTASVVVAGGVVVAASPAFAAVPTITSVVVSGSTTNKVVTSGTTVLITGTGFSGMVDNSAESGCSVTPVVNSKCSQVRFNGLLADANTTGYTLATRYTVVSDTQIYAVVPTITPFNGIAAGSPVIGTGSIRVVVVNTTVGGTGALSSVPGTTAPTELFYRQPLTAAVGSLVTANPLGGGTITVGVTPISAMTSTTFTAEKITAYFMSTVTGSPQVIPAPVAWKTASTVSVVVPPGSPADNFVGIMLVHDGITGTPDNASLKYLALISKLESCPADVTTVVLTALPACTGPATAPGTDGSVADIKVTGKGFTGVGNTWSFDGAGGTVVETCTVVSDSLAYCHLGITTVPTPAVAAVTFTTVDPDGAGASVAPVLAPTVGSILIYSSLV